MEGTTGRTYGRVVWEDRWLVAVYWFAVTEVLLAVGSSGLLAPFFELAVIVPLVVGLSGVFIALWLANRERNKRITENHFYKLHILGHVKEMLGLAASLFRLGEPVVRERLGKRYGQDESMSGTKQGFLLQYLHHKGQIEMLNVNTYVPADIRHRVLILARTAGHSISGYYPGDTESNIMLVEDEVLKPFEELMDSEYFTKDRDEKVKDMVSTVGATRCSIRKRVDAWKKRQVDGEAAPARGI